MSTTGLVSKLVHEAVKPFAWIAASLLLAGCSYEGIETKPRQAAGERNEPADPAPAAVSPPPAAAKGERVAVDEPPAAPVDATHHNDDRVHAAESAATVPQPRNASSPTATAPAFAIELKRGVALAQTLPNGTAMGFSIDYRFLRDGPRSNWRYLLRYQAGDGRRFDQPVALDRQGTLQQFVGWRPEDGPFHARIVGQAPDGAFHPLSAPIELRE
ncbi:MAG: hypothetical protein WD066_14145 [Planctomycetaceae bacterium]